MGWLARQFGLACDNVESYALVTADGETVRATRRPEPRPVLGAPRRAAATSASSPNSSSSSTRRRARRSRPSSTSTPSTRPRSRRCGAWRDLLPDAPREATFVCDAITAGEGRSCRHASTAARWCPSVSRGSATSPPPAVRRNHAAGSGRRSARTSGRSATSSSRAVATRAITTACGAIRPVTI